MNNGDGEVVASTSSGSSGGKIRNEAAAADHRYNDYVRRLRRVTGLASEHVVRDLAPLRDLPHRADPRREASERLAIDHEKARADLPLLCLGTEGPSPTWKLRRIVIPPSRAAPLLCARKIPNARDPRRVKVLRRCGYDEWNTGPPTLVENPEVPAEEEINPVLVLDSSEWPESRSSSIELEPHECNVQRSQLAALGLFSDIEEDMRSVDSDSEPLSTQKSNASSSEDEAVKLYKEAPVPEDRPMRGLELDEEMEIETVGLAERRRTISEDGIVSVPDSRPPIKRPMPRVDEDNVETVDLCLDEFDDKKRVKIEVKKQADNNSSVETVDLSLEDDDEDEEIEGKKCLVINPKCEANVQVKSKPLVDYDDDDEKKTPAVKQVTKDLESELESDVKTKPLVDYEDTGVIDEVIEIDDFEDVASTSTAVVQKKPVASNDKPPEVVIDLLDDSDDDDTERKVDDKEDNDDVVAVALAESIQEHEKHQQEIDREREELEAALAESRKCHRVELEKQYEEYHQIISKDQQNVKNRGPDFDKHYNNFAQSIRSSLQAPELQTEDLSERLEKIYKEFTLAITSDGEKQPKKPKQQQQQVVEPSTSKIEEMRRESAQSASSSLEASLLQEDDDLPVGSPALSAGSLEDRLLEDHEDDDNVPLSKSTSGIDSSADRELQEKPRVNSISTDSEGLKDAGNVNIESAIITGGETSSTSARIPNLLRETSFLDNHNATVNDKESRISDFHQRDPLEVLKIPSSLPAPAPVILLQGESSDPKIVKLTCVNSSRDEIAVCASVESLQLSVERVDETIAICTPNNDNKKSNEEGSIPGADMNQIIDEPENINSSQDSTTKSSKKIALSRILRTSTESSEDFSLHLEEEEEGLQSDPEQMDLDTYLAVNASTTTGGISNATESAVLHTRATDVVTSAKAVSSEGCKTTDTPTPLCSTEEISSELKTDVEITQDAVNTEQSSIVACEKSPISATTFIDKDVQMETECSFEFTFSADEDEKFDDNCSKVSTSSTPTLKKVGETTSTQKDSNCQQQQLQESQENTSVPTEQDEAAVASSVLAELIAKCEDSIQNKVPLSNTISEISAISDKVHCNNDSDSNIVDSMDNLKFKDNLKMNNVKVDDQSSKVPAAALDYDNQGSSDNKNESEECKFYQIDSSDAPLNTSGKELACNAKIEETSSALSASKAENADNCVERRECNSAQIKVYKKCAGKKDEIAAVRDHQYSHKLFKLDTSSVEEDSIIADKTEKSSVTVRLENEQITEDSAESLPHVTETCISDEPQTIDASKGQLSTITPVECNAKSLQVQPVACSNIVVARLEIEKETSVDGIVTSRTLIEFVGGGGVKRKADESMIDLVGSPKKLKSIQVRPLSDSSANRFVKGAKKLVKQTLLFELPSEFAKWCLLNSPRLFVGYNECLQRSEAFWGARCRPGNLEKNEIPMISGEKTALDVLDVFDKSCSNPTSIISEDPTDDDPISKQLALILGEQSPEKNERAEEAKIFQRRHSLPILAPLSVRLNLGKRPRSTSTDAQPATLVTSIDSLRPDQKCVNKTQTVKQKSTHEGCERMRILPSAGYVETVPELEDSQSYKPPVQNQKRIIIKTNIVTKMEKRRESSFSNPTFSEQSSHGPPKRQKLSHNNSPAIHSVNQREISELQSKMTVFPVISPKININVAPLIPMEEEDSDDDEAMCLTIDTEEMQDIEFESKIPEHNASSHIVAKVAKPCTTEVIPVAEKITACTAHNHNTVIKEATGTQIIPEELDINENSKKCVHFTSVIPSSKAKMNQQSDLNNMNDSSCITNKTCGTLKSESQKTPSNSSYKEDPKFDNVRTSSYAENVNKSFNRGSCGQPGFKDLKRPSYDVEEPSPTISRSKLHHTSNKNGNSLVNSSQTAENAKQLGLSDSATPIGAIKKPTSGHPMSKMQKTLNNVDSKESLKSATSYPNTIRSFSGLKVLPTSNIIRKETCLELPKSKPEKTCVGGDFHKKLPRTNVDPSCTVRNAKQPGRSDSAKSIDAAKKPTVDHTLLNIQKALNNGDFKKCSKTVSDDSSSTDKICELPGSGELTTFNFAAEETRLRIPNSNLDKLCKNGDSKKHSKSASSSSTNNTSKRRGSRDSPTSMASASDIPKLKIQKTSIMCDSKKDESLNVDSSHTVKIVEHSSFASLLVPTSDIKKPSFDRESKLGEISDEASGDSHSMSAIVSSFFKDRVCENPRSENSAAAGSAPKESRMDTTKPNHHKTSNTEKKTKKKKKGGMMMKLFGSDSETDEPNQLIGKKHSPQKSSSTRDSRNDDDKHGIKKPPYNTKEDSSNTIETEQRNSCETNEAASSNFQSSSREDPPKSSTNETEVDTSAQPSEELDSLPSGSEEGVVLVGGDFDYLNEVNEPSTSVYDSDSGYNNDEESKESEENSVCREKVDKSKKSHESDNLFETESSKSHHDLRNLPSFYDQCVTSILPGSMKINETTVAGDNSSHSNDGYNDDENEVIILEEDNVSELNNTVHLPKTMKVEPVAVVESPKVPEVIVLSDSEEEDTVTNTHHSLESRREPKIEKESDILESSEVNESSQQVESTEPAPVAQVHELPEVPEPPTLAERTTQPTTEQQVAEPTESANYQPAPLASSGRLSSSFRDQILDIIATCCSESNKTTPNSTSTPILVQETLHAVSTEPTLEARNLVQESSEMNVNQVNIESSAITSSSVEKHPVPRPTSPTNHEQVEIKNKDPNDPMVQRIFNLVIENVPPETVKHEIIENDQPISHEPCDVELSRIHDELLNEFNHVTQVYSREEETPQVRARSVLDQLRRNQDRFNIHFESEEDSLQSSSVAPPLRVRTFASETFSNVENAVRPSTSSQSIASTLQQSTKINACDGNTAASVGLINQQQPGPSWPLAQHVPNSSNPIQVPILPQRAPMPQMLPQGLLHQMQIRLSQIPNTLSNVPHQMVLASQIATNYAPVCEIRDPSISRLPLSNVTQNSEEFQTIVRYRTALLNELLQCLVDLKKVGPNSFSLNAIIRKFQTYGTLDQHCWILQITVITIAQCVHSLTQLTDTKDRTEMMRMITETTTTQLGTAFFTHLFSLELAISIYDGFSRLKIISPMAHLMQPFIRRQPLIPVPNGLPNTYNNEISIPAFRQLVEHQIVCLLQSYTKSLSPANNNPNTVRQNVLTNPNPQDNNSSVNSNNTARVLSSSPGQASTSNCPGKSLSNDATVSVKKEIDVSEINNATLSSTCLVCGEPSQLVCDNCKKATYCSKECQEKHWKKKHYKKCKPENTEHS
ncbi:hypothetical protein QAD02_016056 [Eretmocerus hayati]|uniref:Uncharacterized protein n=1 Tax=Eretmocerus hayati TaxID=131215 RepID=A0ACC2PCE5_9HYME|nr:hypothetical protein QAD02_016056 [Eretmocerus hayati]